MSPPLAWFALVNAGLLDIRWAISMKYAEGYTRLGWSIISMCSMKLPRPRVPGAMQRAALLRRTGTHAGESEQLDRWAPAPRGISGCRPASGAGASSVGWVERKRYPSIGVHHGDGFRRGASTH